MSQCARFWSQVGQNIQPLPSKHALCISSLCPWGWTLLMSLKRTGGTSWHLLLEKDQDVLRESHRELGQAFLVGTSVSFGDHGWDWWLNSELLPVFHADAEPDCVLYSPSTGSHHSRKLWGNCTVWDSSGFLHPSPASPPQWCLRPSDLYKHKLAWEHSKSFCFSSAQVLGLPDRWAERLECLVSHQ